MSFRTNPRIIEGITIVDCAGLATSGSGAESLESVIRELAVRERHNLKLAMNFSNVRRIDASGIGALVSGKIAVTHRGGRMVLFSPNRQVKHLLELTQTFRPLETEAKAVAALREN